MKRLTSDLPETYPLLTLSWTIRGLPEWIRPHGVWQNSDQNKPILWMSNSKRVKVEGGWLGPTCSVPSEVNQISCFLPFPTCGEEWAEPWIKYKARYMISCWKDPPPSDQQSVSQQCGDPQAGVMMLSLKRASPAQSERWPREDPPHLAWAAAAVKKQKKMRFSCCEPGWYCSQCYQRQKGTHTHTEKELPGRCLASLGSVPRFPSKCQRSHSLDQVKQWPWSEGQVCPHPRPLSEVLKAKRE